MRDPGLVHLPNEARSIDAANTDVDNIIVGDGMLGEVVCVCFWPPVRDELL